MISKFFKLEKTILTELVLLQVLVVAISNYLITYPVTIFGQVFTWGAFVFPFTIVLTDLTYRLIGKEAAKTLITLSYIPAILVSILALSIGRVELVDAIRISLASGFAYLVGLILNTYIFDYVTKLDKQWNWLTAAGVVAVTFIDTYLFFYISFADTDTNYYLETMWREIAFNQAVTKIAVSWILFVPLYGAIMSYIQKRLEKR